ncbi:MAG: 2-C-methyl-D-erythritol 2,4-cyclodiphosphate synthase [Nitrospirae bacterium]|nr:2-C-methyl-D-erythritol 2,4-cyclodiphosphate synthase [Nitrospirota bacterium]
MRAGIGYDVHRLVEGRKLVLGGVDVPYELGLLGHSDADVLLHALMDAILGAAGLGDIGRHFPDTDPAYKGASSRKLLVEVAVRAGQAGFRVNNCDCVIVAQRPKLASFIPAMRLNIAEDLNIPEDRVNVKATTTEGLGPEGRGEGIASFATCTLSEEQPV